MGSAAGGNEAADLYKHLGVERTATPRAIHAAYRVLSDRRRRAAYDASLSRPAPAYASVLSACMLLAVAPLAMVELSTSVWLTVLASLPRVEPPVIAR